MAPACLLLCFLVWDGVLVLQFEEATAPGLAVLSLCGQSSRGVYEHRQERSGRLQYSSSSA